MCVCWYECVYEYVCFSAVMQHVTVMLLLVAVGDGLWDVQGSKGQCEDMHVS